MCDTLGETPRLHVEKKLLATPYVKEVCTLSQVKIIVLIIDFGKCACSLSGGELDEKIDTIRILYLCSSYFLPLNSCKETTGNSRRSLNPPHDLRLLQITQRRDDLLISEC